MNQTNNSYDITGFTQVIELLSGLATTAQGQALTADLKPILSELELRKNMRETTQARKMLDDLGTPPLPRMEGVQEYVEKAVRGELLQPEQLESVGFFLTAVKRLKSYLAKGKENQVGIAFYSDDLLELPELAEELERSIRGGRVDDFASTYLRDVRRELQQLEDKIRIKAESALKTYSSYAADSFVVKRNGRICIPIKKEYRGKVNGSLVDKSATGMTLFMEPASVTELREEYEWYLVEEETELHRILYTLMNQVAEREAELRENIRIVVLLDFLFAKGKLSAQMKAVEPVITTERYIRLVQARHPALAAEECVPLDFELGNGKRGIVVTGPNTGGKTVAIKTVGLLSLMACSGLHVPCQEAEISMNDQVLCDIGDGQNMADNLSTFSAHIRNVLHILQRVSKESLVILDELGSGTDPAEGMGIAVAILEKLRQSGCLFLATTHYPEVKEYADRYEEIVNARMAFDRESLRPLYRLEIGKSGESCALYIAKRLGIPDDMLRLAAREAYGKNAGRMEKELKLTGEGKLKKVPVQGISKIGKPKPDRLAEPEFNRGDSVEVGPEGFVGIVVKTDQRTGRVLVQVKREKMWVNHKRLKLKVAAAELYPEDYDFSIIFDTVENRKARHKMDKGHQEGLTVQVEE